MGTYITYPPVHFSIRHPSIHLSTHPPIHPFTHPPTHSSIYPSIYPLTYPSTHPFIQFTIHSSIHLSIHLPHPPSFYPPTLSPIHPLIHQFHPFIHSVSCLIIFHPLPPALPPTFPFLVVELCIQSCCPPPFLVTFELQHGTRSPVCSVVLFKTAGKGTAP